MQLVTFGEAMLRLTPRGSSFDVYVGGAELNVAVAAARLGVASRWVSRLPEYPAGRAIASRAREQGVDVADGATHYAPPQSCDVVDPLDAGDAFAGGLIAARLHDELWDRAVRDGVSLAAKKHGTRGDFSTATSP